MDTLLCLNPHCKAGERIFVHQKQHQDCQRWVLNFRQHMLQNKYLNQNYNPKKFQLEFEQAPISFMMSSQEIKKTLKTQVEKYMHKFLQKIRDILETVQFVLKTKIDCYFQPINDCQALAKDLIEKITSQSIDNAITLNTKVNSLVLKIGEEYSRNKQNKVFSLDIAEHEQKIFKDLQQIIQLVFCDKSLKTSDIGLSYIEKENLAKYLKANDDHNKRLHKLSIVMKADKTKLYYKKPKYYNINTYHVDCSLCQRKYISQSRKQMPQLFNTLIDHLLNDHIQEIGYHYIHLCTEKFKRPTNIQQILHKMINYQYESLQFLFKGGKRNYNFFHTSRKNLTVQILIKGQSSMFPFMPLYINQYQQFYSILALIAHRLQNSRLKSKQIIIYCYNIQISQILKTCELFMLKNITYKTQKKQQAQQTFQREQADIMERILQLSPTALQQQHKEDKSSEEH